MVPFKAPSHPKHCLNANHKKSDIQYSTHLFMFYSQALSLLTDPGPEISFWKWSDRPYYFVGSTVKQLSKTVQTLTENGHEMADV